MQTRRPRNQDLVLGALRAAPGQALTAYEVLARLEPAGLRGAQTVYRALDALRQAGLIHRIESLNAFTICTHAGGREEAGAPGRGHQAAFAVCRDCHAVRELEEAALDAVVGVLVDRTGYRVQDRVIELVGACPACAASAPASRPPVA
jgi:Fur family transcriptional regulator, zinc uptake regulator